MSMSNAILVLKTINSPKVDCCVDKNELYLQALCWPVARFGLNIVTAAPDGHGSILGYLLPGILHVLDQPSLRPGDGPIMVVLVPTHNRAMTIYDMIRKLTKFFGLTSNCLTEKYNWNDQVRVLEKGCEIAIATVERFFSFVSTKVVDLKRSTYFVLDNTDLMLEMDLELFLRFVSNLPGLKFFCLIHYYYNY
jgi:superfamily II DNA/RNA helicase